MFLLCTILMLLSRSVRGYTVGFSYSVAGLLFPYHAGVTHKLRETGHLLPSTPLNGASGGALAAACASSVTTDAALASSLRISARCTSEGSFLRLGGILRDELATMCTDDMVSALNARPVPVEFLYTSAPGLQPRRGGPPFDSPGELIDVLAASCHIPLYSGPVPVAVVRGEWGVDGFLAAPGALGCRPARGADGTVFCTPFASLGSGAGVIAPLPEEIPFTPEEYVALALGRPGPDKEQHEVLFELGVKCAARWIDGAGTASK